MRCTPLLYTGVIPNSPTIIATPTITSGPAGLYVAATLVDGTTFSKALSVLENVVLVSDLHATDADLDKTAPLSPAISRMPSRVLMLPSSQLARTGVLSFVASA